MEFYSSLDSHGSFKTVLLPFDAKISQAEYEKLWHGLKNIPKPESGSWLFLVKENTSYVLFPVDTKGNLNAIARQFRLLTVKTSMNWKEKTALDATHVHENLLGAIIGMKLSEYKLKKSTDPKSETGKPKKIAILNAGRDSESVIQESVIRAASQMAAMRLIDLPPNIKTPDYLADWAVQYSVNNGFDYEILRGKQVESAGLHALYAVGKGSENPPVFIVCKYRGKPKSPKYDIALIGKGITFDTGGISIKPSTNMHYMKSDMAGGAAMLCALEAASKMKLPLNIAAIVPSAENAVGANSLRPSDIIQSYSGKTIEVIDTDAEGRLILADALAWSAKNIQARVMIDMATLTGSSVRTFGKQAAALFSENEALLAELQNSGKSTGEKLWPLPLWSDYDSYIHSDVADVSNLPVSPAAGSIAAAKFLQVFTDKHAAWAHIDMPGMSFDDSPFFKTKTATGYGVQLITDLMKKMTTQPDKINF